MKNRTLALNTPFSIVLITIMFSGLILSAMGTVYAGSLNSQPLDVPSISVLSPVQNNIYDEQDIWLNFTVSKPASWIKPTIGNPILPVNLGKITQVAYLIDGIRIENITVNDDEVHTIPLNIKRNFDFSFNLTELSPGEHSVQVIAYGEVYVSGGTSITGSEPFSPVVTAPVVANSSIINFIVIPSPTHPPQPEESFAVLPIVAVSCAFIAVVGAVGLIYYLKKHKH